MKVQVNCKKCRERLLKEAELQYLKYQYKIFDEMSETAVMYVLCGVLNHFAYKKKRSKKYIQELFDDMVTLFATKEVLGHQITMEETMDIFEKEYGIDWSRIKVNHETEKQMITRYQKSETVYTPREEDNENE